MADLIPKMVVTGLAAAISPVAVMFLISVMMRKHARRNSIMFLSGFSLVLLAIAMVAIFLLKAGSSGKKSTVDGYIDVALGILCLAAMLLSLRSRKTGKEKEAKDLKASRAFVFGMTAMAVNATTIVIYVAGTHSIVEAKASLGGDILALLVLTLVTLTTLLIPIFILFAFPTRSEKVLGSLSSWLSRHHKIIGAGILLVFGIYLLIKGISEVV